MSGSPCSEISRVFALLSVAPALGSLCCGLCTVHVQVCNYSVNSDKTWTVAAFQACSALV